MAMQSVATEAEQRIRMNDIRTKEREEEKEREKAKRNSNFIMMYREHMPEMRWLTNKSGKASNILNFIMEHMDYQNTLMCSYKVFEEYFSISQATVARCIKLLQDNGFLDVLKSGTSNIYIVNSEVVWCSWDNQKKYCKFSGNVLVSATENKDYEYRSQFEKLKLLRTRENIKE